MLSIRCQARILFSAATRSGRLIRLNLLRNVATGTGTGTSTGSGSRSRSELMRKLSEWHASAFSNRFLLFTNVGISLTLSCLGDVMEQHLEIYNGEIERFDSLRTSHMATSGVTVGVICHYWYKMLDKRMPGRSMRVVAKKIVLDQLICSPVYISVFFVTLGLLEKKDKHEVWEEIKEKAWKLYAAEWTVWPAAQFINFYWIPTHYRIFYDNIISLGYDVLTSKVKHTKSHIKKIP
ncbi:mpv17-like protein 2 [Drosophila obscura]|uniref:mpv17-like protein 2 n=1 Tax=Drosophila obscura TaxID=7282 RepID=UPI001BB23FD5|nr:mpv17-like protein 2 [Drosophila obscura]